MLIRTARYLVAGIALALVTPVIGQPQPVVPITHPSGTSCSAERTPLLILGTYHMANPGLDAVNTEADDVLAERRQREIEDLTTQLVRFAPTRIAVEAPYRSAEWSARYARYRAGQYSLSRNEIEQIAFRLARRLGLSSISPVDYPMRMDGLTPSELVDEHAPADSSRRVASPVAMPGPLTAEEQLLRRSTVAGYLLHLNSDTIRVANERGYMQLLLPAPGPALYARADLLTNWYKRNLRIFSNLNRVSTFRSDRMMLLIGAGHVPILRQLAAQSGYYCLVEPSAILRP